MTHDEVVQRAAKWLSSAHKCGVILTEVSCWDAWEIPDAIGWKFGYWSVLVECKAHRSDFLKEKNKKFRRNSNIQEMGQERWFMAPKGIIKPEEIPEGWGLAEITGKQVRKIVIPPHSYIKKPRAKITKTNLKVIRAEMPLLLASLRRFAIDKGLDVLEAKMTVSGEELNYERSEEDTRDPGTT